MLIDIALGISLRQKEIRLVTANNEIQLWTEMPICHLFIKDQLKTDLGHHDDPITGKVELFDSLTKDYFGQAV